MTEERETIGDVVDPSGILRKDIETEETEGDAGTPIPAPEDDDGETDTAEVAPV